MADISNASVWMTFAKESEAKWFLDEIKKACSVTDRTDGILQWFDLDREFHKGRNSIDEVLSTLDCSFDDEYAVVIKTTDAWCFDREAVKLLCSRVGCGYYAFINDGECNLYEERYGCDNTYVDTEAVVDFWEEDPVEFNSLAECESFLEKRYPQEKAGDLNAWDHLLRDREIGAVRIVESYGQAI